MEGTIRTQDEEVREHLKKSLIRIGSSVGQLHGANVTVELESGLPALINSKEGVELARQAAIEVVGAENVGEMPVANMGGEDFAFYIKHVPGCYIRFGAQIDGKEYPAHSSSFVFDENALLIGSRYFRQIALNAGAALGRGDRWQI